MKYERISLRAPAGAKSVVLHKDCKEKCELLKRCEYCDLEKALLTRLCELEDRIENEVLVEIPCKVGDKLYGYRNDSIKEIEVTHFVLEHGKIKIYGSYEEWQYLFIGYADDVGKTIFHKREEAETALKESDT